LEQHADSVTEYTISTSGVNIPVGFNYYFSPKFYVDYTINFNFIFSPTHSGIHETAEGEDIYLYEYVPFETNVFKPFYTTHAITFHRVIFRRAEIAMGWQYTLKNSILKIDGDQGEFLTELNKDFSKFSLFAFDLRYYLFQIKSKKI
jgi:hypothetical protein